MPRRIASYRIHSLRLPVGFLMVLACSVESFYFFVLLMFVFSLSLSLPCVCVGFSFSWQLSLCGRDPLIWANIAIKVSLESHNLLQDAWPDEKAWQVGGFKAAVWMSVRGRSSSVAIRQAPRRYSAPPSSAFLCFIFLGRIYGRLTIRSLSFVLHRPF